MDMQRWAFHSQMFFLSRRIKEHADMQRVQGVIIQDRSLYENAEIFARNLYERGAMTERDWQTYHDIYQTATNLLRPPDLVLYLQADVPSLVDRIRQRGRVFEQEIDVGYLQDLNRLYETWVGSFTQAPVITIPTNTVNYLEDPIQLQNIVEQIRHKTSHGQLKLIETIGV